MTEIVLASYKPKIGKEKELENLIARHVPVLKELGLITNRPRLTFKSKDGTYVELIEWINVEAADKAHEHPAVAEVWEAMSTVSEFKKISDLPEAVTAFSHYQVVPGLSELFQ